MSRSKEVRRIEAAIVDMNPAELRWALSECATRKQWSTQQSDYWYRIEQRGRAALRAIGGTPKELDDT